MTITVRTFDVLPPEQLVTAYHTYSEVFAPVKHMAAQRHLMTFTEFSEVASDARVTKYLAYDSDDKVVGVSTLLNDLDAWPLLEPEYFRWKFPQQFEDGQVWYIGFVCTMPAAGVHVFTALVYEMLPRVVGGVACMDFCTANVDRRLPDITLVALLRKEPSVQVACLDAQSTYAFRFDGLGFPQYGGTRKRTGA